MAGKDKIVFYDFWASWCAPCKIMNPIIEELEEEYQGKVKIKKIEMDDPSNQELIHQFQIMAVPTYIIEKDGQIIDHLVGAQPKSNLTDALNKALL